MSRAALDAANPAFVADPYPALARLRALDPVHWSESLDAWALTRYDDVKAAINDDRFSANRVRRQTDTGPAAPGLRQLLARWVVFTDPPTHTRLRALMNKAFTSREIAALEPRIRAIVDDLFDGLATTRADGSFDLIRDIAFPLPVMVIADVLGVPRSDHAQLKVWSDELATFVGTSVIMDDRHLRAERGISDLAAYFRGHIIERRARPRRDLLSRLIQAEDAGKFLDDDELVANCIMLLFAGHETTTNLIGNGALALMRTPGAWAAVRDQPALVPSLVEEALRYDGPIMALGRVAARDTELRGKTIRGGDKVFCFVNAANRDPDQFPEPDRFDVRRTTNRHVTFGFGIHFCIGAPLARLEGKLAFERLLGDFAAWRGRTRSRNGSPRWCSGACGRCR